MYDHQNTPDTSNTHLYLRYQEMFTWRRKLNSHLLWWPLNARTAHYFSVWRLLNTCNITIEKLFRKIYALGVRPSYVAYLVLSNNSCFSELSCWPPVGMAPLCWGGKPCDKNCCCRERNCCSSSATTWISTWLKSISPFSLDIKMFSALPQHLCQQQVFFQCQTWVGRSHRCSIGLVSR